MLERAAVDAISGLTLTVANYDEVIAILKKCFGNKQQIINKYMDILINLEVVTAYNLKGLHNLFDKVETQVPLAQTPSVPTAAGQDVTSVSQGTTPQSSVPSQTNSTCMCNNVRTPVLLQTARAIVFRPDRLEFPVEVRILFDIGSQRSYL